MLISRVWLAELLADAVLLEALSDDELTVALTGLGLEVEGRHRTGEGLGDVVVAEIIAARPHPDADRLRVVELHDGDGVRQVVCGAPNVPAPGGRVLFARPGTRLPGGLEIGARAVRGVDSEGMICSETELDIGPGADGIVVLEGSPAPGIALHELVAGVRDTLIELSVTPNRPDALGHVGVARDLAVKLGRSWEPRPAALPVVADDPRLASIEALDGCGRYYGIAFAGAEVGPSPLAARVRLHRLGLRPLSNAVDITNLVLMQWGQPLHVFDRAVLGEHRVVVRRAAAGEPLRTLDGRDLSLVAEDLVIADAHRPMALAGIMGGEHSGVAAGTTTLLLEAAWFHPAGIRRSARRHGISTDSSQRFERGVDHGAGLTGACAEAAALLQRWCSATPVAMHVAEGHRPTPVTIHFRPERCAMLLGMEVPRADIERIFAATGVEVDAADDARWRCVAPTHRPDLAREVDLVDEVVRHHGLERLPMRTTPATAEGEAAPPAVRMARRVAVAVVDALRECGLHEVVSLAFARPAAIAAVGDDPESAAIVRLTNPMRTEAGLLRTHLLPGLLDALALNLARHARPVALFECGRTYRHGDHATLPGPTAEIDAALPAEAPIAAVLCGVGAHADAAARTAADPRRVGQALLHVLVRVGTSATIRVPASPVPWLHPGAQAELVLPSGVVVGRFGRVHPQLLGTWDLPRGAQAAFGELELERLPPLQVPQFAAVPRFPGTARDLSIDVSIALPVARIVAALDAAAARNVGEGEDPPRLVPAQWRAHGDDVGSGAIVLIEDYRGEGVAPSRRALLLRMHYGARTRSVTDAEVQQSYEATVESACAELRAADGLLRRR